ncbi:RNA polymerase sigma factor [Maricaulis sp.]|uniref:RNA polymerase sigma factor n=1 Tax=Maricaulis sp. TaxID=1486257 RepID=UPI0026088A5C|nr:RNA polymerase sigma factor [Maricaulis sp.]
MRRDKKRVLGEYLVAAAQAGDRKAFDRLARLWQPDLLRHAYRLCGEADAAQDVLQEAWLDIVRGLGGLQDGAAFPAWAYRIVTRKTAAMIRKRQSARRTRAAIEAEPVQAVDGSAELEQRLELNQVARALAQLPPDQRSAMALYHRQEMSVAEIAVVLDVPAGTVKTRLMHARRKIRAALETAENGDSHE